MADAGVNAIERGLRAALAGVGLSALLGGGHDSVYNMLVPPGAAYPAVVFNLMTSDFEGRGFGSDAESMDYLVKGITKIDADGGVDIADVAGDISEAIDAALHGGTITATGKSVYHCSRQRRVRYMESDAGRVLYVHSGAVYRLWVY